MASSIDIVRQERILMEAFYSIVCQQVATNGVDRRNFSRLRMAGGEIRKWSKIRNFISFAAPCVLLIQLILFEGRIEPLCRLTHYLLNEILATHSEVLNQNAWKNSVPICSSLQFSLPKSEILTDIRTIDAIQSLMALNYPVAIILQSPNYNVTASSPLAIFSAGVSLLQKKFFWQDPSFCGYQALSIGTLSLQVLKFSVNSC